jgi:hypothetical protein
LGTADATNNGLCVACDMKLSNRDNQCQGCQNLVNALQSIADPSDARSIEQARQIASEALKRASGGE